MSAGEEVVVPGQGPLLARGGAQCR